ncbi:MAG: carboxymuconolactone decarboxylase family protein [Streptosporangiaceae bacterium]
MRIDYAGQLPAGTQPRAGLERAVRGAALEPGLIELARKRASQINGRAHCLTMHHRAAWVHGKHFPGDAAASPGT